MGLHLESANENLDDLEVALEFALNSIPWQPNSTRIDLDHHQCISLFQKLLKDEVNFELFKLISCSDQQQPLITSANELARLQSSWSCFLQSRNPYTFQIGSRTSIYFPYMYM